MEATDLENKQLFRSGIGDRNFIERFCSRESVAFHGVSYSEIYQSYQSYNPNRNSLIQIIDPIHPVGQKCRSFKS